MTQPTWKCYTKLNINIFYSSLKIKILKYICTIFLMSGWNSYFDTIRQNN